MGLSALSALFEKSHSGNFSDGICRSYRHHFSNIVFSLKFGVFFVDINYIYLSFMQIHAAFYFNYIIYFALLIFCCQDVATPEPYTILSPVQSLTQN